MDQRDILIRTIIGEAANEGPEGWAAVANVIRNRANDPRWPDQPGAVALQPKQFSAWNSGAGGNDLVRRYKPSDPIYQRVGAVVDQVMSGGPDNTGGATHYYSPRGMEALVSEGSQSNRLPGWLQQENERRGGNTVTIGGHIFTGRAAGSSGAAQPYSEAGQIPVSPALQAAGFTQEQIAAAFGGPEQPQQQIDLAAPAPQAQIAPRQQSAGYQSPDDPLQSAMSAFQNLQQRRKGLLSWL